MKKPLYLATIMTMILALGVMSDSAEAAKPQKQVNGEMVYLGNGYPSGFHYNLHFLAKRLHTFTCPDKAEYAFETPDKNVIYVPRVQSADIGVLVESGRKGAKNSIGPTLFEATDWCSGFGEGDYAALKIPPDPIGYLVYARITGKPFLGKVKDENTEVYYANLGGCLSYAEDETLADNNLILLGLVTSTGAYVPTCTESVTHGEQIELQRTDTNGSSGRGVKKATNITPIFLWSGDICDIVATAAESTAVYCCVDAPPADGIYEHCDSLADLQQADPTLTECPDAVDISAPAYGGLPYSTVYASCSTYTNEWVFNIADFVGYLWSVDSNGAYNINVRFYPCSEQPAGACGEIGSSN